MNENTRQSMRRRISSMQFACWELHLFLDTHPCNMDALEYFEEFKKQRVQALREYAKYYGPLTLDTAHTPADYWCWINEPWPWQEGGC